MIRGLVFDKEGCLFDFNATWGDWARVMIAGETGGDAVLAARLADALDYDMDAARFRPGSVVIAEPVDVTAEAILAVIGGEKAALIARMNAAAREVTQVEATPLKPFFAGLKARGLTVGLATNDAEAPARRHLERANVTAHFDFIAGYDSGHGAKPGPGQLLAFCAATGQDPADCAMIGDSLHDMMAGRAAGMTCIGVLTGPAPAEELAPMADVVLPSIAAVPDWLDH